MNTNHEEYHGLKKSEIDKVRNANLQNITWMSVNGEDENSQKETEPEIPQSSCTRKAPKP